VKEVLDSQDLGVTSKLGDEPVTRADTGVQCLLLSNLQAYFPKASPRQLTIVAEEDPITSPEQ
jgi:3'-phosphoadenosine 5'-phosphosulfate (PAPS) 3'-phosphatase